MKTPFEIGELKVKPGKIERGWINVAKTYYGDLKIPAIVANGLKEGKTLFLCTGIHGTEYVGMDAILRLMDSLDATKLKGIVLAIPFFNVPAFEYITREGAFDKLNLNRVFPGKKEGFLTEKLAYLMVEEIFPKVDCAIDLHGGQPNDLQVPICGFFATEDDTSLRMAKAFGIETLWDLSSSGLKGTFADVATERGIPNLIVEVGGEGRCRKEWVQLEIRGFMNVMKELGMLDGKPEGLPSKYQIRQGFFRSGNAGGFLRPSVDLGSEVEEGQLLGNIIDFHGNVLEKVLSPMKGKVLGLRTLPKINPGDWTFWVARTVKEIS
jgi:predicted deacylase